MTNVNQAIGIYDRVKVARNAIAMVTEVGRKNVMDIRENVSVRRVLRGEIVIDVVKVIMDFR